MRGGSGLAHRTSRVRVRVRVKVRIKPHTARILSEKSDWNKLSPHLRDHLGCIRSKQAVGIRAHQTLVGLPVCYKYERAVRTQTPDAGRVTVRYKYDGVTHFGPRKSYG